MFRHNSFWQCNPLDAMRNTTSNSDSPAGCSSVGSARTSTRSRFRMSFSQICLGGPSHYFYDSQDSQAKRTYRIHPRRNLHPRSPWAHEDLLRVLSDRQRLPRELHKVRHRNHYVAVLPAAAVCVNCPQSLVLGKFAPTGVKERYSRFQGPPMSGYRENLGFSSFWARGG